MDRDQFRLDQAHSSYKQKNDNNYIYKNLRLTTENFAGGITAFGSDSFFLTGQLMLAARLVSEENFIWILHLFQLAYLDFHRTSIPI
jgi:hypothetical protein